MYATATVSLDGYGADRELARRSWWRACELAGEDDDTVDLALLAVPGLRVPGVPIRAGQPRRGERMLVPGYSGGEWSITRGPIVGVDESDFTVRLLLGPGASGVPVIGQDGRLVGVVTLDNGSGTICVGPRLLAAFLTRLCASFSAHPGRVQRSKVCLAKQACPAEQARPACRRDEHQSGGWPGLKALMFISVKPARGAVGERKDFRVLTGVFRGSEARTLGLVTEGQLRGARYRQVYPDIYLPADMPDALMTRSRMAYLLVRDRGGVLAG